MSAIKIFSAISLFLGIFSYVRGDCEVSMEAADKCGMKAVIFGNRDQTMPTNDAELDSMCGQIQTNLKCVKDYNDKCLKGRVHMAIDIALSNGKKFVDKRCNNPKDRQDFLTHVKCIVPKEKLEPLHICSDKHLVMLTKLKDIPKEERVHALCCTVHMSQDCLRTMFKKSCNEDTLGYWDDAWDELSNDNMEFACGDFDTMAKCEKDLNPDVLKMLKDAAASDDKAVLDAQHKFKSELTTAIEIMEFFD